MKKHSAWIPAFGVKGWYIAFLAICFYYIQQILDGGMNTLFTTYNTLYGWPVTSMSAVITIGGWLAIIGIVIFGAICKKKGTKFIASVSLALLAVGLVILGMATSFTGFVIGALLFLFSASGFGIIAVGQYGADWFPTTKGMYMGMATMGITAGSATINLIMNSVFHNPSLGISGFMYIFAGVAIVLMILVLLSKNTPEEAGAFPDNDRSMTQEKVMSLREAAEEYKKNSPWTTKKVLRTKETWLIGVGWGLPMLVATGVMTHLVETVMSYGYDLMWGITLLSTLWPAGVVGNYIGGVVDEKFGTKTATIMVVALEMLGCLLIIFGGHIKFLLAAGIALFMFAISANTNVCMSMTATVFGREDFENAWPIVSMIYKFLTAAGIYLIALVASATSYRGSVVAAFIACVISLALIISIKNKRIASNVEEITQQ